MKTLYIIIFLFGFAELFSQTGSEEGLAYNSMAKSKETSSNDYFLADPPRELKRLLKVNVASLAISRPSIAFEQRLGKNFSSETSIAYENSTTLVFMSDHFLKLQYNTPHYPNGYSYRGYQMFKFYFNPDDKQLLGNKTHTFYGNYFSVYISALLVDAGDPREYWEEAWSSENFYFSFLGFSYGYQFRVGNFLYVEPQIFLDFPLKTNFESSPDFHTGFRFKAGFSIASLTAFWK